MSIMNKTFSQRTIMLLVLTTFQFYFTFSCNTKDSNPITADIHSNNVNDTLVKNIRWDLIAIDSASRHIDISSFNRFSLILRTGIIWADNGCNVLQRTYEYHGDMLVLSEYGGIPWGCEYSTISFDHLRANPTIKITSNKLTLFGNGATYYYSSNFMANVGSTNISKNAWSMTSSNDSNFNFFDSLKLYPMLYLNSDRTFKIEYENNGWWNALNYEDGVFGINDSSGIEFTPMGRHYIINDTSNGTNRDLFLICNMERVTRYENRNQVLKLTNDSTGIHYIFQK